MSGRSGGPARRARSGSRKLSSRSRCACVVSFMGIGLVDRDPCPRISHQSARLTPSEVTLLFTSYLVVTAVAMLVTHLGVLAGWAPRRPLSPGWLLIVVFSAAAGAAPSINAIVRQNDTNAIGIRGSLCWQRV